MWTRFTLRRANPGVNYTSKGKRGLIELVKLADFSQLADFCIEKESTWLMWDRKTPGGGAHRRPEFQGDQDGGPQKGFCPVGERQSLHR